MEHAVPSENFQRESGTTFKFSSVTNRKIMFPLQPNRNFRNLLVNGKHPVCHFEGKALDHIDQETMI